MGDGPPVAVGESHPVEALRLNDDGEGVAQIQGFTVFIPGLLPGESGQVEIVEVAHRFARARLVAHGSGAVSPDRTDPACAVFGACGGCQLQHLAYEAQLSHKREVVRQALARIGGLSDVPVLPTLGMASPWRYRNHLQVPLAFDAETGRYVPGFFAPESHDIVPTHACHLAPESVERLLADTVDALNQGLVTAAHEAAGNGGAKRTPGTLRAGGGLVHHLIVRQSWRSGEQMLIFAVRRAVNLGDVIPRLTAKHPALVSIGMTVQPRPVGPVWGNAVQILHGRDHVIERLLGLEFVISPRSFFQVNTAQAEALYRVALEMAEFEGEDRVLDAYCGTGTLTLLAASRVPRGQAVGVELVDAAVADARRNAERNGIDNVRFVAGRVEHVVPEGVSRGERFDVVLLDPPRKGCEPEVLAAVAKAHPRRVVYVSCNPATFARDARRLTELGFRLERVQPVDMFPQTSHVECCGVFFR
jgi:23S rRNA (uracil1939-C5)-methyltransferase